jgi:predicted nucleic acid-binding Zn ribbon protein
MYKLVRGGENLNSNNEILQKKRKRKKEILHMYMCLFFPW